MAVGIRNDELVFEFPEVHKDAVLTISFQRTLRIPDDHQTYGLPPGLGRFPLKDVDSILADRIPSHWPKRGGVVLPLWQAEAMWLSFSSRSRYPFAVKVAAGKINAVSGKVWKEPLDHDAQDFVEVPGQPWLDGFNVSNGTIKQFVAMPLGSGYSVEEQVTGKADHGGLQVIVYPLKAEAWERMRAARRPNVDMHVSDWLSANAFDNRHYASESFASCTLRSAAPRAMGAMAADMGLGAGGRMKQDIYVSRIDAQDWDARRSKCFVAIANSLTWQHLTGEAPPHPAPTAKDYANRGLPWYDYYDDAAALSGFDTLGNVKSVKEVGESKGEAPLPENESFDPQAAKTVKLGKLPATGALALAEREF